MGGGHGWFEPAMFLFPFAMLIWSLKISMAWAFVLAGIMQYTAYGLLVDYFKEKKKERLAIVLLLVAHLIVAFLLLLYFKNHISQ